MLLPQTLTAQLTHIKKQLTTFLILVIAVLITYSVIDFNAARTSFNTAGIYQTTLPAITAYTGDFLRQYLGWTVGLISLSLLYVAMMRIKGVELKRRQKVIFILMPLLFGFSSSIFFDTKPGNIPPQGVIAMVLAHKWLLFCVKHKIIYIYTSSMVLLNILNSLALAWCYGIDSKKVMYAWSNLLNTFEWLMLKIGKHSLLDRRKVIPQDTTQTPDVEELLPLPRKRKQPNKVIHPQADSNYTKPSVDLLSTPTKTTHKRITKDALHDVANQLQTVLQDFGIEGNIIDMSPGPVVTLFEFEPAAGIKTSRVISLAEDIARSMSALSARIAVIPGKNVIGIELPNQQRETVYMRSVLESDSISRSGAALPLILGEDISGKPIVADLTKMPHLLVAGTTGSGKSVAVNAMILSLLYRYTPQECKFIMVDPKMLELSIYDDIPHLLTPVVTDPKKAVVALKWAVKEMENRYQLMSKLGVRNIDGYNQKLQDAEMDESIITRRVQTGFDTDSGLPIYENQKLDVKPFPFIVVIVDEMADLMLVAGKDIEASVQRLAQMARAAGIHLIMATQRPSVDVITGTIKANFPTRISFQVTSKIDSRTILGEQGAEQLLGRGDMLYMAGGGRIKRVHGPFVKDSEVEDVVNFLKAQGQPEYIDSVTEDSDEETLSDESQKSGGDELYNKALDLVLNEGKASTSFIQRHLQIGYNRAARVIDEMEKNGVVSPANHVGKREILLNR